MCKNTLIGIAEVEVYQRICQEAANGTGVDLQKLTIVPNSRKADADNAEAELVGDEMHFASGMFSGVAPKTVELFCHELQHYIDQQKGQVAAPTNLGFNQDPALEKSAKKAETGDFTNTPEGTNATQNEEVAQFKPKDKTVLGKPQTEKGFYSLYIVGDDAILLNTLTKQAWYKENIKNQVHGLDDFETNRATWTAFTGEDYAACNLTPPSMGEGVVTNPVFQNSSSNYTVPSLNNQILPETQQKIAQGVKKAERELDDRPWWEEFAEKTVSILKTAGQIVLDNALEHSPAGKAYILYKAGKALFEQGIIAAARELIKLAPGGKQLANLIDKAEETAEWSEAVATGNIEKLEKLAEQKAAEKLAGKFQQKIEEARNEQPEIRPEEKAEIDNTPTLEEEVKVAYQAKLPAAIVEAGEKLKIEFSTPNTQNIDRTEIKLPEQGEKIELEKPAFQTKTKPTQAVQDAAPVKENFGTGYFERLDKKFKENENALQPDELARYQAYLAQQPQQQILDAQKAEAKAKSERKQAIAQNIGAENRLAFGDLIKNLKGKDAELEAKLVEIEKAIAENQKILIEANGTILTRPKMDEVVENFAKLIQSKEKDVPTLLKAFEAAKLADEKLSETLRVLAFKDSSFTRRDEAVSAKTVFDALKKEGDAKVAAEKAEAEAKDQLPTENQELKAYVEAWEKAQKSQDNKPLMTASKQLKDKRPDIWEKISKFKASDVAIRRKFLTELLQKPAPALTNAIKEKAPQKQEEENKKLVRRALRIPSYEEMQRINIDEKGNKKGNTNCYDCAEVMDKMLKSDRELTREEIAKMVDGDKFADSDAASGKLQQKYGTPVKVSKLGDIFDYLRDEGENTTAIIEIRFSRPDITVIKGELQRGGHAFNMIYHEKKVRVFDAQTGRELRTNELKGHFGKVEHAYFDIYNTTNH